MLVVLRGQCALTMLEQTMDALLDSTTDHYGLVNQKESVLISAVIFFDKTGSMHRAVTD